MAPMYITFTYLLVFVVQLFFQVSSYVDCDPRGKCFYVKVSIATA